MFGVKWEPGADPYGNRVGFVKVKGRLWLIVDECGCGAADCLATQLYAGIARTGPSITRRPRVGARRSSP